MQNAHPGKVPAAQATTPVRPSAGCGARSIFVPVDLWMIDEGVFSLPYRACEVWGGGLCPLVFHTGIHFPRVLSAKKKKSQKITVLSTTLPSYRR